MGSVSTITIGTTVYSVYGSEADVKAYLAGRLGTSVYDNASSGDKKSAHIQATRWIDRELWQGTPTDLVTPQPLAFPRTGLSDCEGTAILDSVVPDEICDATAELILILLGDADAAQSATSGSNVKSVGAGSAKVEFFRPGAADGSGSGGGVFPVEVQKLVRCYLDSASGLAAPTASGTDRDSSFCDDDFTLNSGWA